MGDSAPDYAVEALRRATESRAMGAAPRAAGRAGDAGFAALDAGGALERVALPSFSFHFRSPNFLSAKSRWVLFVLLLGIAVLALVLAWDLATNLEGTGDPAGGPAALMLVVAALALAFAFADVMGFGSVDLSTSIGQSEAAAARPRVTAKVPEAGSTGIDPAAQVEVTFSEPIDAATLTATTLTCRQKDDGTPVAGSVTTSDDGLTGRFAPADSLLAATTYQMELTGDVRSVAGAFVEPLTWMFTTAE
jgi:methionine-rich copper-binding protein CopC